MNTNTKAERPGFWRNAIVASFVLVAGLMYTLMPGTAHAAPAAGTVIGNQATATYVDATATSRNATSNLVQTTVQQVKSFTLTANGARTAAPGQTVYYPHTITNTGNGTDTYALTTGPSSTSFGAAGPHTNLFYYLDANGDGVPDNGTPITTTGPLPSGPTGIFRFVAAGTVPAGAANASTADITVTVIDTSGLPAGTQTNLDTTTVANSVIAVTKSIAPSNSGPGGVTLTITLAYQNTGTAAASTVTLTDALPANMVYQNTTGRWSTSGAAVLTEANDGFEQGVAPQRVDFRSVANTVTAIIESVPAGVSGNVRFDVAIPANLAPQVISNTATYSTATQGLATTNAATYTVLQTAGVAANGANNNSGVGTNDPLVIASQAAGSSFTYDNYIWNLGNGTDTFDITIQSNTFPVGTTVTLLQTDGATTLINSGGSAAPDTGPIPGRGGVCTAPLVTDGLFCGYRVVVRVTLPAGATGGPYEVVKRATSAFNPASFDDMTDRLTTVALNSVDVTNDVSVATAGAGDGLGSTGTAIIRTNTVNPTSGANTTTRFRVFVNNTGAVSDSFNLTATFAATTAVGVVVPTLPGGWSVAFFADGGVGNCSTIGGALVSTGPIANGANRLVCAEVTLPSTVTGNAIPGQYDFDIRATSTTNALVTDVKRDRVVVNPVRLFTITPNNNQQTFPGGSVTYTHSIMNSGNVVGDTANFAAGCLTDSSSAAGWTSTAYIDSNLNGTLEVGVDTLIVCGTTNIVLNPGQSRTLFVRVFAPGGALAADPPNITTITATYGAATAFATDTTSVTDGLLLAKEQQAVGVAGCGNNNPPAGSYSNAAIPAGANTVPAACIAYRITATNTTAGIITSVVINDIVPANTRMHYACSGNGVSSPSVTSGAIAGTTPLNGATGTVTANVGTLNPAQVATLYFCVMIDP